MVNCFRKTSFGLVTFATFLTSPVTMLGSSIYLTSWINGTVSFFVVQNFWKFWTLGSMLVISLVVGKIALEAGIWGVCRNKKRKLISLNIRILLQARGSSMLEGVRGAWHCLFLKSGEYLDFPLLQSLEAYPLDPLEMRGHSLYRVS